MVLLKKIHKIDAHSLQESIARPIDANKSIPQRCGHPDFVGKIDLQANSLITKWTIKTLHTANAEQIFLFFLITDAPNSYHLSKQTQRLQKVYHRHD